MASVSDALAVAEDRGFEWEVSILKDGEVSPGEYEQAYDRYMACGVTYSGDEVNFNDFTAELSDSEFQNGDSFFTTCLVDSAFELYPDLVSVGVGR